VKDFSKGVRYYTKATAEIGFPEDDCACVWCPLMTRDPNLRDVCGKTGEILTAPKYMTGLNCPLKFEKEEGNEK
jgi:hypothetical protein